MHFILQALHVLLNRNENVILYGFVALIFIDSHLLRVIFCLCCVENFLYLSQPNVYIYIYLYLV